MEPIDIRRLIEFRREFQPKLVYMSQRLKVPLLCLEPGQGIPPHASATGLFYVIEGHGYFTLGEEKIEIRAGSLIVAEAGVVRGIEAQERTVVLAVQAP